MGQKKLLYINACMRDSSRTSWLAKQYLDTVFKDQEYTIHQVIVKDLNCEPMNGDDIKKKDEDIANGRMDKSEYALAREFADADKIVIAAPFWDSAFPSKLKVYIEHICVQSVTFGYEADGRPKKLCKADQLVYITTAGGPLRKSPAVKLYWEELCEMFAITDFRFYCADKLDLDPTCTQKFLQQTLEMMVEDDK